MTEKKASLFRLFDSICDNFMMKKKTIYYNIMWFSLMHQSKFSILQISIFRTCLSFYICAKENKRCNDQSSKNSFNEKSFVRQRFCSAAHMYTWVSEYGCIFYFSISVFMLWFMHRKQPIDWNEILLFNLFGILHHGHIKRNSEWNTLNLRKYTDKICSKANKKLVWCFF